MTNKSNTEQLKAAEQFHRAAEQFDKDIGQLDNIEQYVKETKIDRIIKMLQDFEEGRMILSSPLKELKIEDFEVSNL